MEDKKKLDTVKYKNYFGKEDEPFSSMELKENDKVIVLKGNKNTQYIETITYNNIPVIQINFYYPNGLIKKTVEKSKYGFLIKEKIFDKKGQMTSNIDYDNLYEYNWSRVKKYLSDSLSVNTDIDSFLNKEHSEIPNSFIERSSQQEYVILFNQLKSHTNPDSARDFGMHYFWVEKLAALNSSKYLWMIHNVDGVYNDKRGYYSLVMDGKTGELLLIKKAIGKVSGRKGVGTYMKYKIVFDKVAYETRQNNLYTRYKGKEYTRKEWEDYIKTVEYKRDNPGFWDSIFGKKNK